MISTPILFIIFNKLEKTQLVFNQIRLVKPKKLFVAADAPRKDNNDDIENCRLTREIIKQVDWKCGNYECTWKWCCR